MTREEPAGFIAADPRWWDAQYALDVQREQAAAATKAPDDDDEDDG